MTAPPTPPARPARPKYQVFVSSTFQDLRDEREAVTWEILKAGHIPTGMENFSALDDRGWKAIQRTIDTTDYYVLIIGGRYGSVDDGTGISWTEREYQYARSKGVPVLAFIRERAATPGDQVETGDGAVHLARFTREVRSTHLVERWTTADDLKAKVALALSKSISDAELDGQPRPGWYRGDHLPSGVATEELARLSAENRDLRKLVAVPEPLPTLEVLKIRVRAVTNEDRQATRDWTLLVHLYVTPAGPTVLYIPAHKVTATVTSVATTGVPPVFDRISVGPTIRRDNSEPPTAPVSDTIGQSGSEAIVGGAGLVVFSARAETSGDSDIDINQAIDLRLRFRFARHDEELELVGHLEPQAQIVGPPATGSWGQIWTRVGDD